jgi:hypothetical protein
MPSLQDLLLCHIDIDSNLAPLIASGARRARAQPQPRDFVHVERIERYNASAIATGGTWTIETPPTATDPPSPTNMPYMFLLSRPAAPQSKQATARTATNWNTHPTTIDLLQRSCDR